MQRQDRLSRRAFVIKTLGLAGGTAALAAGCSTLGLPKVSKAQARYQDRPNGTQRCERCVHFIAPNRCSIVDGDISPHGWSTYFMAKIG